MAKEKRPKKGSQKEEELSPLKDLRLARVIYVYEDGSEFECLDPELMEKQIEAASSFCCTHGWEFKLVRWKKIK